MSPRVRIEDGVGGVLFDATCSDIPVSGFHGDSGTNLTVRTAGVVDIESPLLMGACELSSGKPVDGKGLSLNFSERNIAVLLSREDGVVSSLRVTVEPSADEGIHLERG